MTGKSKNSGSNNVFKQEAEIERLRDLNKWTRLSEYSKNLISHSNLGKFHY